MLEPQAVAVTADQMKHVLAWTDRRIVLLREQLKFAEEYMRAEAALPPSKLPPLNRHPDGVLADGFGGADRAAGRRTPDLGAT
jgi:hypothetical protein